MKKYFFSNCYSHSLKPIRSPFEQKKDFRKFTRVWFNPLLPKGLYIGPALWYLTSCLKPQNLGISSQFWAKPTSASCSTLNFESETTWRRAYATFRLRRNVAAKLAKLVFFSSKMGNFWKSLVRKGLIWTILIAGWSVMTLSVIVRV